MTELVSIDPRRGKIMSGLMRGYRQKKKKKRLMFRGNFCMQIVTSLLKRHGKLNIQRITAGLHGQIRLSSVCFQVIQLWQKNVK